MRVDLLYRTQDDSRLTEKNMRRQRTHRTENWMRVQLLKSTLGRRLTEQTLDDSEQNTR